MAMRHQDVSWRTMTALDLPAVVEIAAYVHKDFYESPAVLAEKRELYPNGAHVLEINERTVGYVLSHPWSPDAVPPLNAALGALPDGATAFYLHDLALLPVARHVGAASFIVAALARHAAVRGFATMGLVAVNNSVGFWQKQDFAVRDLPELTGKLLTYEPSATYMVRTL
jgi:ribosomal protein S18 acetylase RimI-like enzyme